MNKIAIISPHFDDGLWSLGLQINDWIKEGKEILYINVFTKDDTDAYGPFQNAVLRKMKTSKVDYQKMRSNEDEKARSLIGISDYLDLEFTEALFRSTYSFDSLRTSEDELNISEHLYEKLKLIKADLFLFPASIAAHRDHTILTECGLKLLQEGRDVQFYLEYPYQLSLLNQNWIQSLNIRKFELKDATLRNELVHTYKSQVSALGIGTDKELNYPEIWGKWNENMKPSMSQKGEKNFRDLIATFRFSHPSYLMLEGNGKALDIGCGSAPHKELIQGKGYEWIGMDLNSEAENVLQGDVTDIPFKSELDMVLCWQVLEYVKDPKQALEEISKSLLLGGQLILSVSALEAVHGHTYHSLSYHWIQETLEELGFEEIEIRPGTNGIFLMLWTYLKKTKIPFASFWAYIACFPIVFSLSAVYSAGLVGKAFGRGGYLKHWVTTIFPLEFAGHIIVRARKGADIQEK